MIKGSAGWPSWGGAGAAPSGGRYGHLENALHRLPSLGFVHTYLETERLTLRRFSAEDVDLLIDLDSSPAVMRYLTGGQPTPPEDIREGDMPSILRVYGKWGGRFGCFAAQEKDSGRFVGWFILRPALSAPPDEAEVGYRLREEEWGKGYATEGTLALLGKSFTELGVRLVWGETMSVNLASRQVMEKVGMTLADTLPTPDDMQMIEGAELGGVRYEISKEQWESHRG